MKKLIPFTLERWQQGNCTVKTRDGREVKQLTCFNAKDMYCFCGVVGDVIHSWKMNGSFLNSEKEYTLNLMLEVDCEVVYVSLFYDESGYKYYSDVSIKQGFYNLNPNFIKEIKVEL
jgi:hypothetical protein